MIQKTPPLILKTLAYLFNLVNFLLIFFLKIFLADCPDPNCSDHGFCVEGSCVCRQGWRGPTCATVDHEARQCLPDCSGHGDFDLETQKCICRGQWTGNDCSKGKLFFIIQKNLPIFKRIWCIFVKKESE